MDLSNEGLWGGVSVRMTKPGKKTHFVGMQMRDDMAMTLGNVKQKEANSIEIKEVQSAARMTA